MADTARVLSPPARPTSAGRASPAEASSPPATNEPLAVDEVISPGTDHTPYLGKKRADSFGT